MQWSYIAVGKVRGHSSPTACNHDFVTSYDDVWRRGWQKPSCRPSWWRQLFQCRPGPRRTTGCQSGHSVNKEKKLTAELFWICFAQGGGWVGGGYTFLPNSALYKNITKWRKNIIFYLFVLIPPPAPPPPPPQLTWKGLLASALARRFH